METPIAILTALQVVVVTLLWLATKIKLNCEKELHTLTKKDFKHLKCYILQLESLVNKYRLGYIESNNPHVKFKNKDIEDLTSPIENEC
jgi:hypothetical protein